MISFPLPVPSRCCAVFRRQATPASSLARRTSLFAAGSGRAASMRSRPLLWLLLCAIVPFASRGAAAQGDPTLEAGMVPYRDYYRSPQGQAGQFDSLDALNGNVTMDCILR